MSRPASILLMAVYTIAGTMAMLAFYWDETWHTDRGRDSFWIPPHQMLYASVAIVLGMVCVWAFILYRAGWTLRRIAGDWALRLAAVGATVSLLDAPIDGFWHNAFGRDAVFWSPPHVLAVASLCTVAVGMLLQARRITGRAGEVFTVTSAALVMATLLVLVMEYESDVPQFAVVWYLPVVVVTGVYTLALTGLLSRAAWICTWTAVAYTLLMLAVVGFLTALGFSTPLVPAIIIPALVYDLARRLRMPAISRAALFAIAVFASYSLYLNHVLRGVWVSRADIAWGLPLSIALGWAILVFVERPLRNIGSTMPAVAIAALCLVVPSPTFAHDPGQGPKVGYVDLVAQSDGRTVVLTATITDPVDCSGFRPHAIVARRARVELRSTLSAAGDCTFTGEIELPDRGRWFVYIEMAEDGHAVEAWLPVIAGDADRRFEKTSWIYVPPTRKITAATVEIGALLYAVSIGLLALTIAGVRREAQP